MLLFDPGSELKASVDTALDGGVTVINAQAREHHEPVCASRSRVTLDPVLSVGEPRRG